MKRNQNSNQVIKEVAVARLDSPDEQSTTRRRINIPRAFQERKTKDDGKNRINDRIENTDRSKCDDGYPFIKRASPD
jgi:hypothetical protein